MENNKGKNNFNYIVADQVSAFEKYVSRDENKDFYNADNSSMGFNPKKRYQGLKKNPYSSIESRYTAKKMTSKKDD